MRILAGLTAASVPWEELLRQEGVACEQVDVRAGAAPDACSVLIVSAPLRPESAPAVREYLARGGGIIGYAPHLEPVTRIPSRPVHLRYLAGGGAPPFPSVGLLDLCLRGALPREANSLRTGDGGFGVFAGEHGGGVVVALPFDVREAVRDNRTAFRAYPFPADRLPAERTSLVSRNELTHLLHDALEFLHHARGLPYAHQWYFPGGAPGVFLLRIDTDAGTRAQVDRLHATARRHGLAFTWFLDVGSHAGWLGRFADMDGQEFGVHCYEHRIGSGTERDRADILRARAAMQEAGIPAAGYAAPYGAWTPDLGLIVESAGFVYSSEFACAADGLPLSPVVGHRRLRTLQVPVHPVCAGALKRAGYSDSAKVRYFTHVRAEKLRRREPLAFYHHPGDESWDSLEALCAGAREEGVRPMRMGDWARWWALRSAGMPVARWDGRVISTGEISGPDGAEAVLLRVSTRAGLERLVRPGTTAEVAGEGWTPVPVWTPPGDPARVREFDLRTSLAGLAAAWQRRRRGAR